MVFICHSSEDKPFVLRLIARLMQERVGVWLDDIEIKVGDSLIDKMEEGLSSMDYLAIVLTPRSVASPWCREELKAAMSRQIKTRRTVVLPLLVEECDLPPFLQEKAYADFTVDFEDGLKKLLTTLNTAVDLSGGKSESQDYHTDFAWDYGLASVDEVLPYEHFYSRIDAVSFSKRNDFSVLTRVVMRGNDVITRKYRKYIAAGLADAGAAMLIGAAGDVLDRNENHVVIDKGSRVTHQFGIRDDNTGAESYVEMEMRRLGEPVDHVMFHWGSIFGLIFQSVQKRAEVMSPAETVRLLQVIREGWS